MNRSILGLMVLVIVTSLPTSISSQTNLLLNPNADSNAENWRAFGQATVEEFNGDKVFVVRDGCSGGSHFLQDVNLDMSDVGKYALLIGRGSSERINADGAITGLPYLYGYMMESVNPKGGTVRAYLQGQQMRAVANQPDEWVAMYGIFRVPEGTVAISFFLQQAERKDIPQNGSAARFDNLGLYLFKTKAQALEFAKTYKY